MFEVWGLNFGVYSPNIKPQTLNNDYEIAYLYSRFC